MTELGTEFLRQRNGKTWHQALPTFSEVRCSHATTERLKQLDQALKCSATQSDGKKHDGHEEYEDHEAESPWSCCCDSTLLSFCKVKVRI